MKPRGRPQCKPDQDNGIRSSKDEVRQKMRTRTGCKESRRAAKSQEIQLRKLTRSPNKVKIAKEGQAGKPTTKTLRVFAVGLTPPAIGATLLSSGGSRLVLKRRTAYVPVASQPDGNGDLHGATEEKRRTTRDASIHTIHRERKAGNC